ncbi:MAG TPA: tetratricopeptide repeat protein [Terriglobales bacterium]|nr:tetratricopeptide repeat protein [Terriglobales bacterium]
MAFGFGFNKQKVLSAAEKFVQQGKLQNAIAEYEKVIKADSKDLTVMNTIGDLYSRLGESEKAADCFKNVGDAYAAQGFTVKAIAMYKKLGKLKSSTESVLRLAELYTQQGLFNDARAQYLQVAEDFLKSGKPDQAIRIFQKTLEMDPDNVPMRMKLAEAYVRMGKKDDAWQLLSAAAETLRGKGQLAAANEILQKMLKLDPENSYALVMRGRASVEAGDFPAAIECLTKVPDLDSNAEGLRALFQSYLQTKRFDDASALVQKLANVHNDISAVFEYANALAESQRHRDALKVYTDFSDLLLRADSARLFEAVRSLLGCVKDDTQLLEMALAIFQKGGETTQFTDLYELLAHGYVQSGDLQKAGEYYKKLMQLEPANQMHAMNYQQVTQKVGVSGNSPHLITAEEGASIADELEAHAPVIEQRYDDDVALAVKAALTDAELFMSYNMPAKALDPLIAALPKAPRDLRLNQKLAALHTRAGRFAEAAVSCRTLESIYHDAGFADEASRYSDLAAKYEHRSGTTPIVAAPVPGSVASIPVTAAAPTTAASSAGSAVVQEFNISAPAIEHIGEDTQRPTAEEPGLYAHVAPAAPSGLFFEAPASAPAPAAEEFSVAPVAEHATEGETANDWEQDFSIEAPTSVAGDSEPQHVATEPSEPVSTPVPAGSATSPAPTINLDEFVEEVRFYLGQGMIEQAEQVLSKVEALAPGAPELAVLRLGIDSAKHLVVSTESVISAEVSDEPEVPEIAIEEPAPANYVEHAAPVGHGATAQPWPAESAPEPVPAPVPELEIPHTPVAPQTPSPVPARHAPTGAADAEVKYAAGTLDAFVADLEESLGNDFLADETPAPEPIAPARPAHVPVKPPVAAAPSARPVPPRTAPVTPPPVPAQHEVPIARAAAASASNIGIAPVAPIMPPVMPPAAAPVSQPVLDPGVSVDLSSMFGELKQELEHEVATTEEDPETHYNLGVAFREMGLLDEAIGELQKVCQSIERGHQFPHVIQAYTWLAQCFLDKGVPEVAARWYDKALRIPNLDQESRTALHYELASALELAGNKQAALNNFLEVYSANIDYRDVSERIKALRS